MNSMVTSDIRWIALGYCFFILLVSILLGEVVSTTEDGVSKGGAAAILGWLVGVGVAHLLLMAARGARGGIRSR